MKLLTVNFYRDAHKQWRWNLKAKNGRIIADSGEGYKRIGDCRKSFNLVAGYALYAKVIVDGVVKSTGTPLP